jgi:hypothetical protein
VTTLKTGMVQLTTWGDALQCAVTNVSGHSLVVSAVRVKNGANATVASLSTATLGDGNTANLPYYSPGQARCEADVADGDADGLRLRAIRSDSTTRGSVDGDAAEAPERAFPRWDTKINNPSRFKVLSDFNNEAVLDRETGLVWLKDLALLSSPWVTQMGVCNSFQIAGRAGWRLPTLQELQSLLDTNASTPLKLPAGHPFSGIVAAAYWSATAEVQNPGTNAWRVNFGSGSSSYGDQSDFLGAWCVRGGQGVDRQ